MNASTRKTGYDELRPLYRMKRQASWLLIVFFATLTYFAIQNLLEKRTERNNALQVRDWTANGILLADLINELQKERGLSSGLIASRGRQFGAALSHQHELTDDAIGRLREAWRGTVAQFDDLAALRQAVQEQNIYLDTVVSSYSGLITPLLDQVAVTTSLTGSNAILRRQMAYFFFLQAKERAAQERALLTVMLSAGDYSSERAAAFHRVKAQERAYQDSFLQLAEDELVAAYRDLMDAPFIIQAEHLRQLVFAAYAGTDPPGAMLPVAAHWFDLATRKIDALRALEPRLSERLFESVDQLTAETERALSINAFGALLSVALALMLLVQLWRGEGYAERSLHLAAEVFRNSVESILIADADARIVEVNRAFTRITGYEREDVLGKKTSILNSNRHDAAFFTAMWDKLLRTGSWEGEVWNRRSNGEIYPALLSIVAVTNERNETTQYIAMIVDLSKYKETEALLEHLRTFDPLTALPNRSAWHAALDQAVAAARRSGKHFAVLDIGLDRFKLINESLGHAVGDEVLIGAAENIRHALRRHDVAARTGGDRFAILLTELSDPRDVGAFSERVLSEFAEPIEAQGKRLSVSISIGVALYPDDGLDSRSLQQNAETALHKAKTEGRGCYRFYSAEMNATGAQLLALEQMLRQALDREEFSVVYQPQIDARSGALIGAEALLRWSNAELGTVSPMQFIPIAEETGVIIPVGKWVLSEACAQAQRWRERFGADLQMAVNLSARQFRRADLHATVHSALESSGLPAHLLELEITEGLLMDDPIGAATILRGLQDLGVKVALDDFGTGYSSLAYLKRFPLDRLKIDRAFVKDLPDDVSDQAISRTVIALGHNLDLEIVAEGVETPAQQSFLAGAGCDVFQGFLFGRPMVASDFEQWFEERPVAGSV